MKILMVSIFAPHFFNWTQQLEGSEHEVYWLDVFDSNTPVAQIGFVHQLTGWRFKWDFKGRYLLKQKAPKLTNWINQFNERKLSAVLEKAISEIRPDVVHSFVIYLAGVPILPVMEQFPGIKWVLSTWGSDLYYYRNQQVYLSGIQEVLSKIDYLFTDCNRDHLIALDNGFTGKFLGAFPGGGGFDLEQLEKYYTPYTQRKMIVIKGYQGKHGKCVEVLKALGGVGEKLKNYELVIFGAADEVLEFLKKSDLNKWPNLRCLGQLPREKVLELMGRSKVYIGNSSSDGMPNTLLEAIVMGAFPVQSNPGGATAELITDGKNGRIIPDPNDIPGITTILAELFSGGVDFSEASNYNYDYLRPTLDRKMIRREVLLRYNQIEQELR